MRPYVVTSPDGNVVASSGSREGAHRASRRSGFDGSSVNRAGGRTKRRSFVVGETVRLRDATMTGVVQKVIPLSYLLSDGASRAQVRVLWASGSEGTHPEASLVVTSEGANRAGKPEIDMTPVEIDTILSKIWGRTQALAMALAPALQRLERLKSHETPAHRRPYGTVEEAEREIAKLRAQIAVLRDEAAPYEAEYRRRGGWNRYFLVTNAGGHVHRGTSCSTCFPTTQYQWIVDLADCDEGKMVEEYGEKACTVCFPNAPVHPSFAGPGLRGSAAVDARAARMVAAAERRAAKEAKVAATKAKQADLEARREAIRVDLAEQIRALAAVGDAKGAEVLAKKQKKHMNWLFLRDLDVDDELLALGLADPIPEAKPGDRHRVRYRYWMWQ